MKLRLLALLVILGIGTAQIAFAGDCAITINREACPGKDAESYAKCDGKASCTQTTKTDSAAACSELAAKDCQNKRLDVTKSKTVTATFDGAPLKGGKDFCAAKIEGVFDPAAEFNKCGK